MRPLYVHGADTQVRLDGPSLRISTPTSADRWFPLRRLSRVVSSSVVVWETAAVLACAGQGVTIGFLDGDGMLIARCIGRVDAHDRLHERLEQLLFQSDWRELYARWLAAVENMAVRSVIRRSGLALVDRPEPQALRRLFRQGAASMNAQFAYERIGREVHSLLVALVTQWLTNSRIDIARCNGLEFNLASDLADVLFWDFQLARLRWLEQRLERLDTVEAPPRAEIVGFFETRRERSEKLVRGLIHRLHRWLIERD
ncbi:MAG TPA: CRISPR-associated endonuclease Cas1 [Methylococcaceae bacterium]|nr:CRISPR-associated endonuclease Cas1 [Methylococcaceae bacterium]